MMALGLALEVAEVLSTSREEAALVLLALRKEETQGLYQFKARACNMSLTPIFGDTATGRGKS